MLSSRDCEFASWPERSRVGVRSNNSTICSGHCEKQVRIYGCYA